MREIVCRYCSELIRDPLDEAAIVFDGPRSSLDDAHKRCLTRVGEEILREAFGAAA